LCQAHDNQAMDWVPCVVDTSMNDSIAESDAETGNEFIFRELDSNTVRNKYLNAYYDFDLKALLGDTYKDNIKTYFLLQHQEKLNSGRL
jgi:hypothetical protein